MSAESISEILQRYDIYGPRARMDVAGLARMHDQHQIRIIQIGILRVFLT